MISLEDKIQKFKKLVYSKQLQEFIPLDQQFISNGITIQSLIKQNAFIVGQIKKIKNVFVNYCKLNQNVYEKITEHQINFQKQIAKMNSLTNGVQRKMNETIKQVKQIYQKIQYQAKRNEDLVEEKVQPLEEAMKLKVDESNFTKQMKKILEEFQNDHQENNLNLEGGSNNPESLEVIPDDGTGVRKKKGKPVYYEQYLQQKQRTTKSVSELSQQLEKLFEDCERHDNLLYKNTSNINTLTQSSQTYQTEIYKLNKDIPEIRRSLNLTQQRILAEINQKTSDIIWQRKLTAFQTNSIKPRYDYLAGQMQRNIKQTNKQFAQLQPRFNELKNDIKEVNKKSQEFNRQLIQFKGQTQENMKNIDKKFIQIDGKLIIMKEQDKNGRQLLENKIDAQAVFLQKQILSVKTTLEALSVNLQAEITKAVTTNINIKIALLDDLTKSLKQQSHQKSQQIQKIFIEIHNIKELLSKKANFTDILINVERKADKTDIKELKDKMLIMDTQPSYLKSTIFGGQQYGDRTRRTISSTSRRKKTSHNTSSRNVTSNVFFNSNTTPIMGNLNNLNNVEERESVIDESDHTSRLFLMGLQNDFGIAQISKMDTRRRMSFTQSKRKRKNIQSAANRVQVFNPI